MAGKATEGIQKTRREVKELAQEIDKLTKSFGTFFASGSQGVSKVGEISQAYKNLQAVISNTNDALYKSSDALKSAFGSMGIVGDFASPVINAITGITGAFAGMVEFAAGAPAAVMSALDDQTRAMRSFEKDMFDLEKRFGGTHAAALDFANGMRAAANNDFAQSLYLTTNEMAAFVRATAGTQLTQEQLGKVVQAGTGRIELYGAATAFAASTGMDMASSARLLNTLMNQQGKSAQEATNMLGMFAGVSKETGLSIDSVTTHLNSAVQGFAKIGMSADFGKPILKGFTDTMNDMGLGLENAIGLSADLTGALSKLTNNYGLAYLTFQRGGLDIGGGGGGGVLGSSIALQAAYLEAEKTGDQSAISDQLVRGMRDTLASFTGGDIVTVQQANQDSSLAGQYYVQQQMLAQYGITDDNSAARVLDMLSRLDEATRTGDKDAQDALKEQIANETEGRDKTLDELEKVNRKLEIQTNLMIIDAAVRRDLDQTRSAAAGIGNKIMPKVTDVATSGARSAISGAGSSLELLAKAFGMSEEQQKTLSSQANLARGGTLSADEARALGYDPEALASLSGTDIRGMYQEGDVKNIFANDPNKLRGKLLDGLGGSASDRKTALQDILKSSLDIDRFSTQQIATQDIEAVAKLIAENDRDPNNNNADAIKKLGEELANLIKDMNESSRRIDIRLTGPGEELIKIVGERRNRRNGEGR